MAAVNPVRVAGPPLILPKDPARLSETAGVPYRVMAGEEVPSDSSARRTVTSSARRTQTGETSSGRALLARDICRTTVNLRMSERWMHQRLPRLPVHTPHAPQ